MPTYSDCTLGTNYGGQFWVEPVFQANDSETRVSRYGWYGDACIGSLGSVHVFQQQWLFSVGWGDGFSIRRINDDGSWTPIYGNTYGNGYNHHNSLAVNEDLCIAIVGQYNTPRVGVIDFSQWVANGMPNDGAGIVKYDNIYYRDATWNFPTDWSGTSYECGLKFAGNWLYMDTYGRDTVNGVYRWNAVTHEYQLLPIANNSFNSAYWEGTFVYDDRRDRMFYQSRWNGGLNVIDNASTDNPTAWHISYSGHGANHCVYKGVVYIDGNPNRLLVGGDWRFFELDISACGPDNKTPVFVREVYTNSGSHYFNTYFPFGSDDPYNENEYKGGNVYGSAFIPIYSDRGWLRKQGWFDLDNFQPVGRCGEDNYAHHRDTWFTDYSGGMYKVTSANGTDYWAGCGYGWDGHATNSYSKPLLLKTNYSVTFGSDSYNQLSDGGNIGAIDLSQSYTVWTPSNTTTTIEVSNNNGASYEVYSGGVHAFNSTGNRARVRYTFNGLEYKMPYLKSVNLPTATLLGFGYENSSSAKGLNYKISGI
mgnify:CR=1 FL=1